MDAFAVWKYPGGMGIPAGQRKDSFWTFGIGIVEYCHGNGRCRVAFDRFKKKKERKIKCCVYM